MLCVLVCVVCGVCAVCVCGVHAGMCFNMCARCQYTRGRFERTHGGFLDGHTGRGEGREGRGVTVSSAHRNLHPGLSRASERFTERNPWSLHIFSLRTGREQHVLESSNHSLYLMKLLSSISPEGHCRRNQL